MYFYRTTLSHYIRRQTISIEPPVVNMKEVNYGKINANSLEYYFKKE
jgi:hypothetical protein